MSHTYIITFIVISKLEVPTAISEAIAALLFASQKQRHPKLVVTTDFVVDFCEQPSQCVDLRAIFPPSSCVPQSAYSASTAPTFSYHSRQTQKESS